MAESVLLSAHIAEQSELILTTPSRLTGLLNTKSVRILKPPVALPGFTVKQYWHERFHDDPGNRWLRGILSRMRGLSEEGEGPSLPEFAGGAAERSEEHTSELQSLMRISYAVFCLKNNKQDEITY